MVLEGSTSGDSFSEENAPSSDFDPYASTTQSRDPNILRINPNVTIDLRQLPRGTFTRPDYLSGLIRDSCTQVSHIVHRPLQQDEATALAVHGAKAVRTAAWGPFASGVFAAFQVYRTRENYKFPFWTPMKEGSRYSPDVFGPFRGQLARGFWNAARFGAYGLVWIFPISMVFTSYAMTVMTVSRLQDPRLKEVNEAMVKASKEKQQQKRGEVAAVANRPPPPGQQDSETFAQAAQRRSGTWQSPEQQPQPQNSAGPSRPAVVDDASPTNGSFEQEFMGTSSDQDSSSQSSNAWGQEQTNPYQSKSRSQKWKPSTTPPQSTGDAWERIRQGAMSSQAASDGPSRPTTASDGFAFSNDDRERELAKGEAQKDFDRRLQQEREGKDFSGSGESGRRW